jgi:hypothetical protein
MEMGISLERHRVLVVGREMEYEGDLEPIGPVMDFLNASTRSTFSLHSARVVPIGSDERFKGITRAEIIVDKSEFGILCSDDPEFGSKVQMLRFADSVIAYTPHAIVRGQFHRGAETRLPDLFDAMQGDFMPVTDASLFPTTDLPASLPSHADLIILNRQFVRFYHSA